MTQVFRDDGTVVPVTRVQAGPCTVTQIKTKEKDGVNSIQIGFGAQKLFRLNRALQGHLRGLAPVQYLRDVVTTEPTSLKRGDTFSVTTFASGDKVEVVGTSKGKGFQGVVKRHGFRGGPATHGHKDNLRMPGSIGAGGVQRVFKDMRMGGHMGDQQVTVKNLEVVQVDTEKNELFIKGAVPGGRNSLLVIIAEAGDIQVHEPASEAVSAETAESAQTVNETPVAVESVVEETAPVVSADAEAMADKEATPVVEQVVEEVTPVVEEPFDTASFAEAQDKQGEKA